MWTATRVPCLFWSSGPWNKLPGAATATEGVAVVAPSPQNTRDFAAASYQPLGRRCCATHLETPRDPEPESRTPKKRQ